MSYDDRPPDPEEATIVPIEALTREATFRRLEELVRRIDPVPPGVVEEAASVGEASRWRSIDDELAVLVADSDRQPEPLGNVRSVDASLRRLSFRAPHLVLEVEVTLAKPRELVCQVVPPQPSRLEVWTGRGAALDESDPFGTFHCGSLPAGPISLRCVPAGDGAVSVATSWFEI